MAYDYKIRRRVEFSETDMAGIMHYSNFFRFMEAAEHEFYRSLGFSVNLNHCDPPLGFPRVHAECNFRKPLRFEDLVEVHLLVKAKKSRALTYEFRFHLPEISPREEAARGELTIVCVRRTQDGKLKSVDIPAEFQSNIQTAPAELFEV